MSSLTGLVGPHQPHADPQECFVWVHVEPGWKADAVVPRVTVKTAVASLEGSERHSEKHCPQHPWPGHGATQGSRPEQRHKLTQWTPTGQSALPKRCEKNWRN